MADFTLNAPGTTNNPWTPASVLTPVASTFGIKSDATGFRSLAAGDFSEFAHNATYGPTITTTVTVASGGASNGDEIWAGAVVRTGANAGAGIGCIIGAFGITTATWTGTGGLGGATNISASVGITRANADVWTVTVTIVGGTATITAKQNASSITFSANTTTNFTGGASLAAGAAFNPQNNDSLYLSQFTGTGVAAGVTISAPTPSGTLSTATTVSLGCTTNTSSGTLYGVIDTSGNISGITAAQVIAAQNNTGGAAAFSGNTAVSGTTPSLGLTGLTPNTTYSYALAQVSGTNSNVLTGSFTTSYVATPYSQTQFFVNDRVVQF